MTAFEEAACAAVSDVSSMVVVIRVSGTNTMSSGYKNTLCNLCFRAKIPFYIDRKSPRRFIDLVYSNLPEKGFFDV